MGYLRPAARADKNGKVVIRHVRDDPKRSAREAIPSDMKFAREQKKIDRNKDFEKIHAALKHREHITRTLTHQGMGAWKRWRLMRTLHPETILVLLDHGIRGRGMDKMPMDIISYCKKVGTFAPLNDLAAYLVDGGKPLLIKDPSRSFGGYDTLTFLLGLSNIKEENTTSNRPAFTAYSKASREERIVQRALVEVAHKLDGDFVYRDVGLAPYPRTLSSYPLIEYIRSHPEKVEQVVKVIKDRGLTSDGVDDIGSLMETMDEVTNPLLDGAL